MWPMTYKNVCDNVLRDDLSKIHVRNDQDDHAGASNNGINSREFQSHDDLY